MIAISAAGTVSGGGTPHARLYLPSSGAAAVSPAFSGSWSNTASGDRLACVTARISSAFTDKTVNTIAGTTEAFVAVRMYVGPPMVAQTITGTIKGQVRGQESATAVNGTLAVHIRVVSNDGSTVRGTLLAVSASDTGSTPFEFDPTGLTNRKFRDVSENAALSLSSLAVLDGDRPVIEIGFRQIPGSSSTSRSVTLNFGDNSGTDLPEDDTTTAANNPWIEFSNAPLFQ